MVPHLSLLLLRCHFVLLLPLAFAFLFLFLFLFLLLPLLLCLWFPWFLPPPPPPPFRFLCLLLLVLLVFKVSFRLLGSGLLYCLGSLFCVIFACRGSGFASSSRFKALVCLMFPCGSFGLLRFCFWVSGFLHFCPPWLASFSPLGALVCFFFNCLSGPWFASISPLGALVCFIVASRGSVFLHFRLVGSGFASFSTLGGLVCFGFS